MRHRTSAAWAVGRLSHLSHLSHLSRRRDLRRLSCAGNRGAGADASGRAGGQEAARARLRVVCVSMHGERAVRRTPCHGHGADHNGRVSRRPARRPVDACTVHILQYTSYMYDVWAAAAARFGRKARHGAHRSALGQTAGWAACTSSERRGCSAPSAPAAPTAERSSVQTACERYDVFVIRRTYTCIHTTYVVRRAWRSPSQPLSAVSSGLLTAGPAPATESGAVAGTKTGARRIESARERIRIQPVLYVRSTSTTMQ